MQHYFPKWELKHLRRKPHSASFSSLPTYVRFDMEVRWDLEIALNWVAGAAETGDTMQRRWRVVRKRKTKCNLIWKMWDNKSGGGGGGGGVIQSKEWGRMMSCLAWRELALHLGKQISFLASATEWPRHVVRAPAWKTLRLIKAECSCG